MLMFCAFDSDREQNVHIIDKGKNIMYPAKVLIENSYYSPCTECGHQRAAAPAPPANRNRPPPSCGQGASKLLSINRLLLSPSCMNSRVLSHFNESSHNINKIEWQRVNENHFKLTIFFSQITIVESAHNLSGEKPDRDDE